MQLQISQGSLDVSCIFESGGKTISLLRAQDKRCVDSTFNLAQASCLEEVRPPKIFRPSDGR